MTARFAMCDSLADLYVRTCRRKGPRTLFADDQGASYTGEQALNGSLRFASALRSASMAPAMSWPFCAWVQPRQCRNAACRTARLRLMTRQATGRRSSAAFPARLRPRTSGRSIVGLYRSLIGQHASAAPRCSRLALTEEHGTTRPC
jgi:hypothetical protein